MPAAALQRHPSNNTPQTISIMASRQFFDPLALLRVSPLLTSTCSLWFAWDQHFFLHIFNRPEHRAKSNELLPSYFRIFFRGGVTRVLVLLSLTMSASVANLYAKRPSLEQRGSLGWYAAGASFAFAHLLFVPAIAPKVQAIAEDSSNGNSTEDLAAWLRINALRGLTVDVAAWASLVVAVTRSLRA